MEVDNKYDKFVVLEWLRKALCSLCVSKCIVEQSNEAADMLFVVFCVSGAGTLCPALHTSLLERSSQKETERRTRETKRKMILNNGWVRDTAEACKYLNGVNLPDKGRNYLGWISKAEWSNYNKGYF